MMKVKDLLEMEISVDVYDNVCDELAIAFEGPMELTEAGLEKFGEVLEYDVTFSNSGNFINAIVDVDDEDEDEFERKLAAAKELFESMAGWCTMEEGREWFKEW